MKGKRHLILGCIFLLCFIVFTLLVKNVDVRSIGPESSAVGFGLLNGWVHETIGVHLWWYSLTDWLGLLFVTVGLGFAALGAMQLFKRRNIWNVDRELLWLGVLYIVMAVCYILSEKFPVNYRPVVLGEGLEPSYPSSHTLLSVCVMGTALLQCKRLLREKRTLRRWSAGICGVLIAVTVVGRLIAGVHWATDIAGGILLAVALVELYRGVTAK